MFNGVVREVENNININFFFDNMNYAQRQKVFAMKVTRFGEIWWCFPKGDSIEPNHAVIYNVRENTILTISISNAGRYALTPANPVSVTGGAGSGATFNITFNNPFKFWVHEVGTDEVDGINVNPIQSYFETGDISLPVQSQINRATQVLLMEPDFVQSGDMTVQAMGRANARSPEVDGEIKVITETAQTPQEQGIYFKEQRRELRFRFESNTVGGNYETGLILAHVQPGDGTTVG